MYSYIADSYAGFLTKGDIVQLFDGLAMNLGRNRSEAARRCRLTGATTYGWNEASYIKYTTKKKVLETCLENDFLNTVEFLLNRSGERTIDILRTVLSTIFSEAIETESNSLFSNLLIKFETIRAKYRGTIRDRLEDEISEMDFALEQKASELDVPLPQKNILDISSKELVNVLPLIVMEYIRNPLEPLKAANNLKFPLEEIKSVWSTFRSLRPTKRVPFEEELKLTPYGKPPEAEESWPIFRDTHTGIGAFDRFARASGTVALDEEQLFGEDIHHDTDKTEFPWKMAI